jgi:hypothetical protein
LTNVLISSGAWSAEIMIFLVDADYSIRELEREAERNGYYLSVELDFREMKKDYMCRKMTPEEWEQYLEWEKEE